MTIAFRIGPYGVRLAETDADLAQCQALRHQCFFGVPGVDAESYDQRCDHLMIAEAGRLVATCRFLRLGSGAGLSQTYAGARYDLTRLGSWDTPMMELGRFCIAPDAQDADVLRLLWGALAQIVDADGIGFLFGCTSFSGLNSAPYAAVFALLARKYQAPLALAPGIGVGEVLPLAQCAPSDHAAPMPPLLRSYLGMGGWVSDHAVVDHQMQTLHVFTGLETAKVPPRRAAALRAMMA